MRPLIRLWSWWTRTGADPQNGAIQELRTRRATATMQAARLREIAAAVEGDLQ